MPAILERSFVDALYPRLLYTMPSELDGEDFSE